MCNDVLFFCFNDTATTEIYTLSLHDALPICSASKQARTTQNPYHPRDPQRHLLHLKERLCLAAASPRLPTLGDSLLVVQRSEEHTSELQSRQYLVCRLLLEKKKNTRLTSNYS